MIGLFPFALFMYILIFVLFFWSFYFFFVICFLSTRSGHDPPKSVFPPQNLLRTILFKKKESQFWATKTLLNNPLTKKYIHTPILSTGRLNSSADKKGSLSLARAYVGKGGFSAPRADCVHTHV